MPAASPRPVLVSSFGKLHPLPGGLPPLSTEQLLSLCDGRFTYELEHRSGRQIQDPTMQRRILKDMLTARPQSVGDFFHGGCDPAQALWDLFYCCCNCCNAFGLAQDDTWIDEPMWFRQYLTDHPDNFLVAVHNRTYMRERAKRFESVTIPPQWELHRTQADAEIETIEDEIILEQAWDDVTNKAEPAIVTDSATFDVMHSLTRDVMSMAAAASATPATATQVVRRLEAMGLGGMRASVCGVQNATN